MNVIQLPMCDLEYYHVHTGEIQASTPSVYRCALNIPSR